MLYIRCEDIDIFRIKLKITSSSKFSGRNTFTKYTSLCYVEALVRMRPLSPFFQEIGWVPQHRFAGNKMKIGFC